MNIITRRSFATLAAVAGSLALGACDNDDPKTRASAERVAASGQTTPAAPLTAAAPPATSPQTTTTTPAATTTAPAATPDAPPSTTGRRATPGAPSSKTRPRTGTAPPKTRRRSPIKGATTPPPPPAGDPQPPAPAPASTPLAPTAPTGTDPDPAGPNPPTDCLREAGLTNIVKHQNKIWSGTAPAGDIFVDGPYGSEKRAAESAAILKEVSRAEAGGRYQVTGALRADVGAQVSAVARCLKERDTGEGGDNDGGA